MAKPYFRYVPDFDYVSRLKDVNHIGDYVTVKNLFKRVQVRPDIFNDATHFTKYTIIGDERPDNIAFKVYKDSNLDWLVLMSNNIVNFETEWPLTQQSFYNYLISKYGTDEGINSVHHYESKEIKDSQGRLIISEGNVVDSDFSITYFDDGRYVTKSEVKGVTNYEFESKENFKKSNIFILRRIYLQQVLSDIKKEMTYGRSSQFINNNLIKTPNTRVTN